jgi:hypothetical protein
VVSDVCVSKYDDGTIFEGGTMVCVFSIPNDRIVCLPLRLLMAGQRVRAKRFSSPSFRAR